MEKQRKFCPNCRTMLASGATACPTCSPHIVPAGLKCPYCQSTELEGRHRLSTGGVVVATVGFLTLPILIGFILWIAAGRLRFRRYFCLNCVKEW